MIWRGCRWELDLDADVARCTGLFGCQARQSAAGTTLEALSMYMCPGGHCADSPIRTMTMTGYQQSWSLEEVVSCFYL